MPLHPCLSTGGFPVQPSNVHTNSTVRCFPPLSIPLTPTPCPAPPRVGRSTRGTGLTRAAALAEAPVARGAVLAAGAADAGQAAALAALCVAAAPHGADVAVTPPAAGASLEAVVPLLRKSRTVGALFSKRAHVPPSWSRLRRCKTHVLLSRSVLTTTKLIST